MLCKIHFKSCELGVKERDLSLAHIRQVSGFFYFFLFRSSGKQLTFRKERDMFMEIIDSVFNHG